MYKESESHRITTERRESTQAQYQQVHGPSHLSQDEATDLHMLLLTLLKDTYWAEMATVQALPVLANQTISPALRDAIMVHWDETRNHVEELEKVFHYLSAKADSEPSEGMAGLIAEAHTFSGMAMYGKVRDAAIISALQKMEHYEIAAYGTMAAFANLLGESKAAHVFETILDQEKSADATLTGLAVHGINIGAAKKEKKVKEEKPQRKEESPTIPEEDTGEFEKRSTYGQEEPRTPNTTGELNHQIENPDIEQEQIRNSRGGKSLDNPSTYMSEATGSPDEEKEM
jgi:ferritin-like metal-binding protein YciE